MSRSVRPSVSHRNGVNEDVFHLTSSSERGVRRRSVSSYWASRHFFGPSACKRGRPCLDDECDHFAPVIGRPTLFSSVAFSRRLHLEMDKCSVKNTDVLHPLCRPPPSDVSDIIYKLSKKKEKNLFFSDSFRYFIFYFLNGNLVKRSKVFDLFLDRIHLLFLPV